MVNFMVDIETLSVKSNAVILTIGCIPFNTDGTHVVEKDYYFYERVDLSSYNDKKDYHMDFSTLLWWLKQDSEPRSEAFINGPRYPIEKVLIDFSMWIIQICDYCRDDKINMWSHGKDFDCVILENAFDTCELVCPWKFWDTRDTRTIYSLANISIKNIDMPTGYKAHNAIGDCLKQIEGIRQSYIVINNIKNSIKNNKTIVIDKEIIYETKKRRKSTRISNSDNKRLKK